MRLGIAFVSALAAALMFPPILCAQQAASSDASAKSTDLPDRPILQPPAAGYKGPMPSRGYYTQDGETYPRFGFRQVADKNYWTLAVVLPSAASAFDSVTTFRALSRGNTESNPLAGPHPTPARLAGIKLGVGLVEATGLYFLKKRDMENDYKGWKHEVFPPRWWKMALVAPAVWFACGGYNLSLGRNPVHK